MSVDNTGEDVFMASLQQLIKVPVFLDGDTEMQVGVMLINPEYMVDFNAGNPLKTHMHQCDTHGKEVHYYSLPSVPRKGATKITVTVEPQL